MSGLVELHLRFHTYGMGWTDSAVRRYVRDAGQLLDELNELTRADCTTRNPARTAALSQRMDELEARIAELREKEELASIRPDLDGREVMDHLGLAPSPLVGRALTHLLELRLAEVLALLGQLSIEPVLLAHPTESTRRTTLRRQQRMAFCSMAQAIASGS